MSQIDIGTTGDRQSNNHKEIITTKNIFDGIESSAEFVENEKKKKMNSNIQKDTNQKVQHENQTVKQANYPPLPNNRDRAEMQMKTKNNREN